MRVARMTRWPHPPDTLSRRDLEANRMREIYESEIDATRTLSDVQLSESLTATLAAKPKGAGWWVFAYGSLLWNPLFPVAEMRPGTVSGLHRRFCLWSLASRGTRECPGLVLGLDRGGACCGWSCGCGDAGDRRGHLLWRREMVVASYRPSWVTVRADGREIVALTFVVRRDHPQYAGGLSLDEQAGVLNTACGAFGSSLDYLERTRVALVAHGIVDPYLEGLAARITASRENCQAASEPVGSRRAEDEV
jgi:cation transport protein ChaC